MTEEESMDFGLMASEIGGSCGNANGGICVGAKRIWWLSVGICGDGRIDGEPDDESSRGRSVEERNGSGGLGRNDLRVDPRNDWDW